MIVSRESVLLDFQTITVSPRRRLEKLLDIRRGILEQYGPQVAWWVGGEGGDEASERGSESSPGS